MIQSLAQLDELYGKNGRRIILDNCAYKVILGANDPETQKALSDLAGTIPSLQWGASANLNRKLRVTGYSVQLHDSEEPFIRPHELAFLKDVILLTPYGVYQVAKIPPIRQYYLIGDIYGLVNPTVSASEAEHIPEEVTTMTGATSSGRSPSRRPRWSAASFPTPRRESCPWLTRNYAVISRISW